MDSKIFLLAIGLLFSLTAFANFGTYVPNTPTDKEFSVDENLISHFPGERISTQTLKLSYYYDDLVIPGPAGMDLVISRAFDPSLFRWKSPLTGFDAYWRIDLPGIATKRWDQS